MGKIDMNKTTLILLAASLAGTQAMAGSVTIPNTFTEGTTASASEVNANFDAVKSAVDENDTRITTNANDIDSNTANITANTDAISASVPQAVLKDANNVYIGRVIGMLTSSFPFVLTDEGYRTSIPIARGRVQDVVDGLFYESTNCLGPAYVGNSAGGTTLKILGTVFIPIYDSEAAYSAGLVLYTPSDEPGVAITANSQLEVSDPNITCNTLVSPIASTLYRAYPNDPNITGIQNTAYSTRMIIE
jgi:hypothetical protein